MSAVPSIAAHDELTFEVPAKPADALTRSPELLHPSLWLGHQLGRQSTPSSPSGFPLLDAELPGQGWPKGVVTELLLPHPGLGELRLLAPAIATAQQERSAIFFDPPMQIDVDALASFGIDPDRLLAVTTRSEVSRTHHTQWCLEQALKSGVVGAIVAWLPPRTRIEQMRRLQLAAHGHDGIAFMLRDTSVREHSSAAALRIELAAAGGDRVSLRILKRRGPPLLEPLTLQLPHVLSAAARRRLGSQRAVYRADEPTLLVTE